jgi:hypothetical protein
MRSRFARVVLQRLRSLLIDAQKVAVLVAVGDKDEAAKEFAEAERLNPKLKEPENRPRHVQP